MENKNNYASDSEVRILLANVSFEELSESDDTSLYSGKNVEVLENSYVSITSKKVVLKVYKRRWFILGLFSLLSFMQCTVWNTWGPIAESSLTAFPSWDAKTIALFGNWGTITFVIFTVPLIWLCDLYGLRVGMMVSALLMALGTSIRCISMNETIFTWMAHSGANFNGIAGIVLCAVPPALSSHWFPPNERTTATGISSVFNQLGNAGGFLLGPLLVREPDLSNNKTVMKNNVRLLRNDILNLMDAEALICAILFFCVVVYFPSKPNLPPSVTSTVQRLNIKDGIVHILKNREVLLLTTAFSLSQGVLGVWLSVMNMMIEMNVNLEPLGFNQVQSGWLGFWAIVASCILALVVARLTDYLAGYMKKTITVLLVVSSIAFTILAMMCLAMIEPSLYLLYATVIIGSCANYATTPLFMELAVEMAFPVDETVVGGFMSCTYNLVGALFLFAFFIPNIGVTWMNYCLVAAPAVSLPFVFLAKEEYRRSSLDKECAGDRSLLVNSTLGCNEEM
ncbi:Disrupted in renal carcinoma protein 2 [Daphnia magna]|uniref:Disrupted in renal carcinoma protein 2 n=1 Tax=Daphnia magna TaxID=35525 RepID=A0A0P5T213_9CRUS|nr:Disrupted in renal carcinoma protein 2 [Daphnia magna]